MKEIKLIALVLLFCLVGTMAGIAIAAIQVSMFELDISGKHTTVNKCVKWLDDELETENGYNEFGPVCTQQSPVSAGERLKQLMLLYSMTAGGISLVPASLIAYNLYAKKD